jgi:hypothetical protein
VPPARREAGAGYRRHDVRHGRGGAPASRREAEMVGRPGSRGVGERIVWAPRGGGVNMCYSNFNSFSI